MRFLAGDVGGTKTNLELVRREGDHEEVEARASLASGDHPGLMEAIASFLESPRGLAAAAFGVAGPVLEGRSRLTNLPWVLDEADLSRRLEAPVRLLNDLEANGLGIAELPPEALHPLQAPGPLPPGPGALIAAGTGLGMAILPYLDGELRAMATEAGHTDFAPRRDDEVALLVYLRGRFGRASWEHVLSGPGLGNLYDFCCQEAGVSPHPEVLAGRDRRGQDPNAVIARLGARREEPAAARALELFVRLYGSEAGNLALRTLARGGLFLGGGIAPRLLPQLEAGSFLESFRDKPPFEGLLASLPVRVILEPLTAVLGARRAARRLALQGA